MRLHDLAPIIVVSLEPIVLRRVMARSQHHPAVCPQLSQRKRKFRRGSGTVKNISITPQIRAHIPAIPPKFCRKMACVMGNHKNWPAVLSRIIQIVLQVGDKAPDRPVQIIEVHRSRTMTGHFRPF